MDRDICSRLKTATSGILSEIAEAGKRHLITQSDDPILAEMHQVLNGRCGPSLADDVLEMAYVEADKRYKAQIPPGYKDNDKPAPEKYGDYILWKQLLLHSEREKKPVILVTDDNKEDWLWRIRGKTMSLRPELREEFYTVTQQPIIWYSSEHFIHETLSEKGAMLDDEERRELASIHSQDETGNLDSLIDQVKEMTTQRRLLEPLQFPESNAIQKMLRSLQPPGMENYEQTLRSLQPPGMENYQQTLRSLADIAKKDYDQTLGSLADAVRESYERALRLQQFAAQTAFGQQPEQSQTKGVQESKKSPSPDGTEN
jgi:hypothetical protein